MEVREKKWTSYAAFFDGGCTENMKLLIQESNGQRMCLIFFKCTFYNKESEFDHWGG